MPGVNALAAASFRDPAGCVFTHDGGVFRAVTAEGLQDFDAFLASPPARGLVTSGRVVSSTAVTGARRQALLQDRPDCALLLEHEAIAFPSYPSEWPPEMLHAAARLTLELARTLQPHGIGLKDATPYNVLFRGPHPVFIDVLSFERRDLRDSTWNPYGQFLRTFLLPLLANRNLAMPLDQIFATRRDGLEPEEVLRWISPLKRFLQPHLSLASLPVWLASRRKPDDAAIYEKHLLRDPAKAQYILDALLRRLERLLAAVAPRASRNSFWSNYTDSNNYSAGHFSEKETFVRDALAEFAPRRVLDAGCNTGHFSLLAARTGAFVTAIDYDPVVVGALWRQACNANLSVLPLVVNLSRPTPAAGWNNSETSSFLSRANGHFDGLLMLALIHHLLITERVPLESIIDLAAGLTTGIALIEFVEPGDSMFQRLVRGRGELYRDLTHDRFETEARRRFDIVRSLHYKDTHRWLYLLKRRCDRA